ncbi:hypothetical protein PO124_14885 [Bacillus licheniformis]|nr:hypothetical protein [Bacillus licheniformis]
MTRAITDVMELFCSRCLKGYGKWIQLWDQDAVFEHPYAPPVFLKIEGKSAIYDYIRISRKIDIVRFTAPTIHQTANRAIRLSNLNVKALCVRRVFLITNSTSAL